MAVVDEFRVVLRRSDVQRVMRWAAFPFPIDPWQPGAQGPAVLDPVADGEIDEVRRDRRTIDGEILRNEVFGPLILVGQRHFTAGRDLRVAAHGFHWREHGRVLCAQGAEWRAQSY